METVLVFGALHKLPPQLVNGAVSCPQEAADDNIEDIGADNISPVRLPRQVHGGHQEDDLGHVGFICTLAVVSSLCDVDRNDDGAGDDGKADEHVAAHACDPQEDGTIHSDCVHVLVLVGLEDGLEPGEKALVHRGRLVLLVNMAQTRGVYDLVPWS